MSARVQPKFSPKKKVKKEKQEIEEGAVLDVNNYSHNASLVFGQSEEVCVAIGVSQATRPSPWFRSNQEVQEFLASGSAAEFGASLEEMVSWLA